MRSYLRLLFAGLLAGSFAWIISSGLAQIRPAGGVAQPPGKEKEKKEKRDQKPPEEDNIPYTFPYDRDAKNQLTAAREYLTFKNIPWATVVPLLQNILEGKNDSLFNTFFVVSGEKKINRISVKTEANRIIAAFPKEGLEFYQQSYGATASALLDEAIPPKGNYDLATIAEVSQKYFHTKAGAEATVLLGTLYLERGNFLEAAYAFERFLTRPNIEDLITPRTLFKACLALKRSGDARHAELLKTQLESLRKATERNGLALGRRTYTYEQLRAEIDRPLDLLRMSTTAGEWAMVGGTTTRAATIEGGPPFLDPIFRSSMFPANTEEDVEEANGWIRNEVDIQYSRDSKRADLPIPGFFPITTPDMVVYRGYNGVYAVAARDQVVGGRVIQAGDLRWVSKTDIGLHQMVTKGGPDIDMYKYATEWFGTYKQTKAGSILHENPLLGSLSHDGQNVYFVDDVAIPPPPVFYDPNIGGMNQGQQYRQSGPLADAIRAGRLVAVDLKSGMVKWELGRVKVGEDINRDAAPAPPLPNRLNEEEADKTTSAFHLCLDAVFLGAPLPLNGKLYVLIEQAGVLRLICLDPKNLVAVPGQTRKPALLWTQKIGRPNTNLPTDSMRRYQGVTLAASEQIIICPTNSGAIVAVDTRSRSLLWAHAYRKINPVERTRPNPGFNPGQPNLPQQLDPDRWRSGRPMIASGRVILTAYDSDFLECLELRTGKVLWFTPREKSDLYVGGIVNDRVVVVGRNQVRAYHLAGEEDQKPKIAFENIAIPTPTGHGVGGKGVYYLPVRQETAGRDATPAAEIWAINVENGEIKSKTAARKRNDDLSTALVKYGLGNLIFQDGLVYAQSAWEIACFPQLEQKRAEMDRLLAANQNDPVGLLTRGELLLDEGKLKAAIADFKAAERNNLPPEKRPTLREKLYLAYTDLVRSDFNSGESILEEYKALCEVPADPDEAPEEKIRRLDETERRQRLYLYLLARGREGQGRLGDAFDHYIGLANMGEAKNLLEMPDEPNVRMRPDVWARGRIESMIRRSSDPAARKSLDDRVDKEWAEVKSGNDLKRLRDFVAVFGPYFAAGAEAQFILSDRLLQTNNESDSREAQTHLAQLRATAEDPSVRARATEALARLMIKNQYMEDAVSLYLQLGKEYADIVVKDGKTGADFMTNLLTDKRLLPYLEPSRYPMPTRMKVEQRIEQAQGIVHNQYEVEPQGDLFPMYRRFRYVLDQNYAQNGSWTLRVYDRGDGRERMTFGGIAQPMNININQASLSKFVQANGQHLLLQFGTMVYCYDLAAEPKGKELWQKNLVGENFVPNPNRALRAEMGPDGDVTVPFDDGYIITLGKATVLQAGYAALLTREGLEVVEPLTRRVLWTRRDIKERTQLYGDSRYIVLVETESNRRPVAARVLRAVDGLPVEGSGDSGRALTNARSYQILGRNALLTEGTGGQPRVLRLFDLGTGKDVWKKEYSARAIPIKSHNSDWAGFVKPNGEAEIIETRTGNTLATLKIDEKNLETDLKPAGQAQLLADAERFYLILDRDPSANSSNGTSRLGTANMLRTVNVNGPIYAFDRGTGKRLWWYGDGLLENQQLVLDRFSEMPVIIAAAPMMQRVNNSPTQVHPVVVIEKARGRLLFDKSVVFDHQNFMNLTVDHKNGTIDLRKQNSRIAIMPDEPKTEAAP